MTARRGRTHTLERLLRRCQVSGSGCWIWVGSGNGVGYGKIWHEGRLEYTHRAAYQILVGPIPAGYQIDHLCRNPSCFNPVHLEAVTPRENTLRAPGPASSKAAQTHCTHGHEFTQENTARRPNGTRRCRECNKIKCRERSARRRGDISEVRIKPAVRS
jgi:hypothetical protein